MIRGVTGRWTARPTAPSSSPWKWTTWRPPSTRSIDNVFAHTGEGTAFRVRVEGTEDDAVRLVVEDDGPGLAGPDVVTRGASTVGSTGLGLDIARRTAEAAGGALRLGSSDGGGARVVLELPRSLDG